MTDAWPSTLPQCPIMQSFAEQRQRNVASFKPDVGPPKQRRRSTAVAVQTNVAFRMTRAQLTIFDTFYETTLEDGTLPFTWNHPITLTNYEWMFSPEDAPTKERVTSGTMRISFTLFRLP